MNGHIHRGWLIALALLALAHGVAYATIVPIWQAPDEPLLYEYVALVAELGRVPTVNDQSAAIEVRLLESLARNDFWREISGTSPDPTPATLAESDMFVWMPRQVGGDPPLYFVAAALPLRLAANRSVENQVRLLRGLNALLLPLVALGTYGAARELIRGVERLRLVPIAAAALVALQPMLAFIGVSVSNDGLANLIGTLLCWAWLVMVARGATPRRVALVLGLLAVGLLTKRTIAPYAALLAMSALVWAARAARTLGRTWQMAGAGALLAALIGCAGWGATQLDWDAAWGWYRWGGHTPVARIASPIGEGAALRVETGEMAAYQLPAVAGDRARRATLRFGARVWSSEPTIGRLVVFNDDRRHEIRFLAGSKATDVETWASIYGDTQGVVLALQTDQGTLYADNIWADGGGVQILSRRALTLPGVREGSALLLAVRYLRLPEISWALTSGQLGRALPDHWLSFFFSSFWGYFGWMHVPFVIGTPWEWALGAFCALGLLGIPLALWRLGPGTSRQQLGGLVGVALVAVLLPVLNAYAMPTSQALQQGRYLFPLIAPFALLLAVGQSALVPARWHIPWLGAWLGFLSLVAGSAMAHLVGHYRA
jgi:hypothetical protein